MSSNIQDLVQKLVTTAELVGDLKWAIRVAETNKNKDPLDDQILIPTLKSNLELAEMVVKECSKKIIKDYG